MIKVIPALIIRSSVKICNVVGEQYKVKVLYFI